MLFELSGVFLMSLVSLFIARRYAPRVGLLDKPTARKLHIGAIPLVGGIGICMSLVSYLLFRPDIIPHSNLFIACIILLTLLGAMDDKYDVDFKIRLGIQAALSLVMIQFANLHLYQLGDIVGTGQIQLSEFTRTILTIFAVVGAINAFNMIDGIDGLLGAMAIVTFVSVAVLLKLDSQHGLAYLCTVICVTMTPYMLMNLGLLGKKRKVFMGDAGSMLIGFSVIWILFAASQGGTDPLMRPVTGLWIIAVPLFDMTAIMIRRIRRGESPFKPDREHLHHIFQRLGLSSRQTLIAISCLSALLAGFGIFGELTQIPEYVMFFLFLAFFSAYLTTLMHVWRVVSFLRAKSGNLGKELGEVDGEEIMADATNK